MKNIYNGGLPPKQALINSLELLPVKLHGIYSIHYPALLKKYKADKGKFKESAELYANL